MGQPSVFLSELIKALAKINKTNYYYIIIKLNLLSYPISTKTRGVANDIKKYLAMEKNK